MKFAQIQVTIIKHFLSVFHTKNDPIIKHRIIYISTTPIA